MSAEKDWRIDAAPIVFFALVIAGKTYYLIEYLQSNAQLWTLLSDSSHRDGMGGGVTYYLTGQFSYIGYYLTSLAFDALVFYSFLVRRGAKDRPKGFLENIFPLITVFVPVLGFTLLFAPNIRQMLPSYPPSFLAQVSEWLPAFPFFINLSGLVIGFMGAAFSIWAISHLKASFGLRTAVRELVTSGPYKRIRHPLYFGEIIHIVGLAILSATPVALYLFVIAVALQAIRAKIEERKFLATVPEYRAFRDSTGFLWPKF